MGWGLVVTRCRVVTRSCKEGLRMSGLSPHTPIACCNPLTRWRRKRSKARQEVEAWGSQVQRAQVKLVEHHLGTPGALASDAGCDSWVQKVSGRGRFEDGGCRFRSGEAWC